MTIIEIIKHVKELSSDDLQVLSAAISEIKFRRQVQTNKSAQQLLDT